jgi:hypothetical protein
VKLIALLVLIPAFLGYTLDLSLRRVSEVFRPPFCPLIQNR